MNASSSTTQVAKLGDNHIKLPQWLDDLIYKDIKANYQPCRSDMIVLNWDKAEIIKYLGTYFPRSFAESYCVFTKYFSEYKDVFVQETTLNIFDFGCGTGGELFGLLFAIIENLSIPTISIKALDGNFNALRLLEEILQRFKNRYHKEIYLNIMPLRIDDLYDMSLVEPCIPTDNHIVLIFKSICEMASLRQFDERNPYQHVLNIMLNKLSSNGIICLADVTSFNEKQQEWLPTLIDKACTETGLKVCMRNDNYNEIFFVSHSCKPIDSSKISWRILKN